MPELGHLTHRQLAALIGVACQHNPVIRAFYQRLCTAGTPRKVARVAAMHKLLTILDAMMKHQTPWTAHA